MRESGEQDGVAVSRDGQCKWIVSTVGKKLVVRNTTRLLRPFQYDNRVFGVKFSPNGAPCNPQVH